MRRLLTPAYLFSIDGFISMIFGLATGLFQLAIFSTAVDLKTAGVVTADGHSLMESALYTLSGYYVLVGALLLLLARVPYVYAQRLSFVLAAHHTFMAIKGSAEAHRSWMVGNPWSDVGIHTAFVVLYVASLSLHRKSPR